MKESSPEKAGNFLLKSSYKLLSASIPAPGESPLTRIFMAPAFRRNPA
jgi:hypothetical protein